MRNYKYEALCLSSALLWALAFPVMKFVGSGVDTVTFLALRFLIAAVVLCVAVRKKLRTITPKLLLAAGGVGLIFALHSFLQVEGLRYTSAANGGFITSLNVVFVPFFAYFFTKKKPTKNVVIGLIAAVASIAGHYIGAGVTLKNGSKIIKPAIITVLILLTLKIGSELIWPEFWS